jgi:outer membrane lipoprotein-sorting protein
MSASRRLATVAALCLPLTLSGCFILSTTRKLPIPRPPSEVQTIAPENLVAQMNQRWGAMDTLTATVEIQASVLKSKEGMARDYTTFRGHILIRKPEMLRVVGQVPVLGTKMFDMASDGKTFSLYVPHNNKLYKGSNALKKRSASQVENMRPGFFLDALIVRGLEPNDLYAVTADTVTVEDAARKHFYSVPEYILSIMRQKPGSQELTPVRVVTFHRDDLLPYEQDLYDKEGNLETQVSYASYADFGPSRYPSKVTIRRPLEEFQIVMTIEKVVENIKLTDDQFQVTPPPEGTEIQKLE